MIIIKQGELNLVRVFFVKGPGPRNLRSKTPLKPDLTLLLKLAPSLVSQTRRSVFFVVETIEI
jgi:hypothetical protein